MLIYIGGFFSSETSEKSLIVASEITNILPKYYALQEKIGDLIWVFQHQLEKSLVNIVVLVIE